MNARATGQQPEQAGEQAPEQRYSATGKPVRPCHAETRTCRKCGCHQRGHRPLTVKPFTKRGPCKKPECVAGSLCDGFVGEPCPKPSMPNGKCRTHGGASPPAGPGHHAAKTLLYSSVLPKNVAGRYEELLSDPQLLSLRREIALARMLLQETTQKLFGGEWASREIVRAAGDVAKAWKRFAETDVGSLGYDGRKQKVADALAAFRSVSTSAVSRIDLERRFESMAGRLESLARSENQRVEMLYNVITAERALALRTAETAVLMEALAEFVPDRDVISRIRARVAEQFAKRFSSSTQRQDDAAALADAISETTE